LLMNVGPVKAVFVFIIATIAMMLFASATQGWFFTKNRIWESVALLLIAFTLFRPGFWLDKVSPPYDQRPGVEALQLAASMPDGGKMRVRLKGPDFDHPEEFNQTSVVLNLGKSGDGETRFTQAGLNILDEDGKVVIDGLTWDSKLKNLDKLFSMGDPDNPLMVEYVYLENERMPKELFYIPAILLLALIILLQRRRHRHFRPEEKVAAA